jgi:SAM-dependent methyltransferase
MANGNPLIRQPWLYESIYPETSSESAAACESLIKRFEPGRPLDIIDVGCGTGGVLSRLAELGHSCKGIDSSEPMIDFALVQHPGLDIELGDMRTFDLGREFDVVLCVGSTFTTNLSNADVHSSLQRFRAHCKTEGLLIIGLLNASRFLGSETFNELVEMKVDEGDFHATALSRHLLNRHRQSFRRVRTWKIDGQDEPVVDDAEFRLFFPQELENYLVQDGFSVLGIWDNNELKPSDLSGRRLYVAARAV